MGGQPSKEIIYSIPLQATETENSTCIRRSFTNFDSLIENFDECPIKNTWELFKKHASKYSNEFCLGSRKKLDNGKFGAYEWKTYKEVEELALSLALSLYKNNLCPEVSFGADDTDFNNENQEEKTKNKLNQEHEEEQKEHLHNTEESQKITCESPAKREKSYKFLGIFTKNREEWIICEQACNVSSIAIVPLYDTLGDESISYIISHTKMKTVVVSDECAEKVLDVLSEHCTLQTIILLDPINDSLMRKAQDKNLSLITFQKLVEESIEIKDKEKLLESLMPSADTVNTLCYTSGTTGKPKGVIMSHYNFVATLSAIFKGPLLKDVTITSSDKHISYLPMAHVFERVIVNMILASGAKIGFYSGDIQKLLEDIQALKPTIFCSVPRLFNRINDKVLSSLKAKSALAQLLFKKGMDTKLTKIKQNGLTQCKLWDSLVFSKTKKLLGGEVRYMLTGSASLEASVQNRMKVLFCSPLLEGYGMTESMGASFLTSIYDGEAGHIGGPLPSIEFKIESIPEMDYSVHDKDMPKGELLMRGNSISVGYFRNEKETRETFKDGWLHTGDVVALLPNGAIKVIDRKKNIFKLTQGEYITPEKIENAYNNSPLVSQTFIFGYSSKAFLVGIVFPDPENAMKWAQLNQKEMSLLKNFCSDAEFKNAIFEEMKIAAKESGLKGFECVKDIRIINEGFSVENNLLTPTFKLKRHNVYLKYKYLIDEMYSNLDDTKT